MKAQILYVTLQVFNSTMVPVDLAYEGFITKYAWLSEAR